MGMFLLPNILFRHNEFTGLLTMSHQTKSIALVTAVNAAIVFIWKIISYLFLAVITLA